MACRSHAVRLTGRGPLHLDLARPGVLFDLLARRQEEAVQAHHFCWWDELIDDTAACSERNEIRGRGDFSSDLLDLAEQIEENRELRGALADQLVRDAPKIFAARLDELAHDEERLAEVMRRATNLALDELVTEPR